MINIIMIVFILRARTIWTYSNILWWLQITIKALYN